MTSKSLCSGALPFLLSAAVFLSTGTSASAQATVPSLAQLAAIAPALECAKLAMTDISEAVGATTHISSAEIMANGQPAPYCRITGYVEPMMKFEVRLPMTRWTQRFVQTGCGGLCGNLNIRLSNDDGCYPAQYGELALASTDMGHSGGMDGQFGEKEYRLRIDFAYRGVHVTTLAAKALIAAFYGQKAKYSYFAGCSDGGREALMEAERYAQDFNGITRRGPGDELHDSEHVLSRLERIEEYGCERQASPSPPTSCRSCTAQHCRHVTLLTG